MNLAVQFLKHGEVNDEDDADAEGEGVGLELAALELAEQVAEAGGAASEPADE